jgi:hypothetical protein
MRQGEGDYWFSACSNDVPCQFQGGEFLLLCRMIRKKKSLYSAVFEEFFRAPDKITVFLTPVGKMRQKIVAHRKRGACGQILKKIHLNLQKVINVITSATGCQPRAGPLAFRPCLRAGLTLPVFNCKYHTSKNTQVNMILFVILVINHIVATIDLLLFDFNGIYWAEDLKKF